MTTRGAITLETLRAPGLSVERSLELSGQWFNELCLWLQSPIGELGNIGWPMVPSSPIGDWSHRQSSLNHWPDSSRARSTARPGARSISRVADLVVVTAALPY